MAFVDYSSSENDTSPVLINFRDLYIQFNRAKLYNVDTELPDTVTITQAYDTVTTSERLAALRVGERYDYKEAVFHICELTTDRTIDFATLSIHSKSQPSHCPPGSGRPVPPSSSVVQVDLISEFVVTLLGCIIIASMTMLVLVGTYFSCSLLCCAVQRFKKQDLSTGKQTTLQLEEET